MPPAQVNATRSVMVTGRMVAPFRVRVWGCGSRGSLQAWVDGFVSLDKELTSSPCPKASRYG